MSDTRLTINALLTKIDYVTVDGKYAPDMRRVLGQEATRLRAAMDRGPKEHVAEVFADVKRVCEMWGVDL